MVVGGGGGGAKMKVAELLSLKLYLKLYPLASAASLGVTCSCSQNVLDFLSSLNNKLFLIFAG